MQAQYTNTTKTTNESTRKQRHMKGQTNNNTT